MNVDEISFTETINNVATEVATTLISAFENDRSSKNSCKYHKSRI